MNARRPAVLTPLGFGRALLAKAKQDDLLNGAAAIAFYFTLAIFPAMIVVMAVIPYLPLLRVDEAIMGMLRQALPGNAADIFTEVVHEVTSRPRGGLLSAGLAGSLWVTSTGMLAVMRQLNRSYGVAESRGFLRGRATAVGLSLLFGALVIVCFSLVVLGEQLQVWVVARLDDEAAFDWLFVVLRWALILFGLLLAFSIVDQLAPNRSQRFRLLTGGSLTGVLILVCSSAAFPWYANHFGSFGATYGSIGAVILLMLWLFSLGLAILLCAQVNQILSSAASRGEDEGADLPRGLSTTRSGSTR